MKKAILFGASGFVGSHLLNELLDNPTYEKVTIVVREKLAITHPKLEILPSNLESLPSLKDKLIGEDVFITIGTTKKKTPNQEKYYQIDHDYPVLAAKLAKENGANAVYLITSVGANEKSSVFYLKTKGETERDILALNYNHTHLFRPSMILGKREENRSMEKFFILVWNVIQPLLIGSLNKYKGTKGENIAKAMFYAAQTQSEKVTIYHWKEMNHLISKNKHV